MAKPRSIASPKRLKKPVRHPTDPAYEMGSIWDGIEPTRTKTLHTRNLNGDLAALNASMYGYGGHSAYLPMPAPQRPEQFAWWDQQKIRETVTRKWVLEHIVPEGVKKVSLPAGGLSLATTGSTGGSGRTRSVESGSVKAGYTTYSAAELRKRLDTPMSFGDGLTESTYVEWILGHAKKFFLVLWELGIPERIFQIVDGSWDDEDLPLTAETVVRLGLENPGLEKRFLKKQHMFLLRMLEEGDHVDYCEDETVALESASGRRQLAAGGAGAGVVGMAGSRLQAVGLGGLGGTGMVVDKVYFPRYREEFYMRARIPLEPVDDNGKEDSDGGGGGGGVHDAIPRETFLAEIAASKAVSHKHIVKIHASYTHQDYGYLLLTPACELNLSQFIKYTPYTFKAMPKPRRRRVLLEWLHCLADALAFMYERGVAHRDIRPRSIMVNQVTYQILFADIGNFRRLDAGGVRSPGHDQESYEYAAPELWQRAMVYGEGGSPGSTVTFHGRRTFRRGSSAASTASAGQDTWSTGSPLNIIPSYQTGSTGSGGGFGGGSSLQVGLSQWVATSNNPSKSDVFSLGCIFLDILSFLMKRRASAFTAHRSKKQRRPRQTATPDQSFHANLPQVETWIEDLEQDAEKKGDVTVARTLRLVRAMLEREPGDRLQPRQVAHALNKILEWEFVKREVGGGGDKLDGELAGERKLCCEPSGEANGTGFNTFGLVGELKLWPTAETGRTSAPGSSAGSGAGSGASMYSSASSSAGSKHGSDGMGFFWDDSVLLEEESEAESEADFDINVRAVEVGIAGMRVASSQGQRTVSKPSGGRGGMARMMVVQTSCSGPAEAPPPETKVVRMKRSMGRLFGFAR